MKRIVLLLSVFLALVIVPIAGASPAWGSFLS